MMSSDAKESSDTDQDVINNDKITLHAESGQDLYNERAESITIES
jgi:hypothetical protein